MLLLVSLIACKTSSTNNNKAANTAHKGEKEFQAYLDRKKAQFKGESVPNISVETIDGKTYNLAQMDGKIVLLNFWFAACKPCITEIPSLNELQSKYKKDNLLVLSISTDNLEKAKQIAQDKKMAYAVVANGKKTAELMEVSSFPTSFLIDKKGIIQEVFIGANDFDATHTYTEVKPHIERLLGK